MKTYKVFVESSDFFTVEAESKEEAERLACNRAASCSQPNEWHAYVTGVMEEKDGN